MNGIETNKYINKKCNEGCKLKRRHMELYKLDLQNVLVHILLTVLMIKKMNVEWMKEM